MSEDSVTITALSFRHTNAVLTPMHFQAVDFQGRLMLVIEVPQLSSNACNNNVIVLHSGSFLSVRYTLCWATTPYLSHEALFIRLPGQALRGSCVCLSEKKQMKHTKKPEPKAMAADGNKPPYFWFGLPLRCNVRQTGRL